MKKLLALLATALVTGILFAPAAQAGSSSDDATLSVSVNESISLTFTDDSADFGPQNTNTTPEQLDTLAYTVSANTGWNVTLNAGAEVGGNGVTFKLQNQDGGGYVNVPTAGGPFGAQWQSRGAGGTVNYLDDVKADISGTAAAGARSQVVTYTATSN